MKQVPSTLCWLCIMASISVAACGDESPVTGSAGKPVAAMPGAGSTSPGKPSAPISLDYEVLGKPIVGLPVAINLRIIAAQDAGPISVQYSINDASSLRFQEGQVERLEITSPADSGVQQITVVPQREGRLYINVSAEVQTPGGSMIKSMAIPIQVGSTPQQPQINGELKQGPGGEVVISMPAVEN
jgi:hypothetical protein